MEKWKKIRNFGTGFILFKIINFVFYTIVSPTIIFIFKDNIISGFTIVFLIIMRSMIIVWLYDKAKQDIFLIEKEKG